MTTRAFSSFEEALPFMTELRKRGKKPIGYYKVEWKEWDVTTE